MLPNSIKLLQCLLKNELVYISVFFFANVILKLKAGYSTWIESLYVVEETVKRLKNVQGIIEDIVNTKVKNVLRKNFSLAKMKVIKKLYTLIIPEFLFYIVYFSLDIVNMKYSPITSVEVERFSQYKSVIRLNLGILIFKNLHMHVVIYFS